MVAERLACHHTSVTTVDELWYCVEAAWSSVPVHSVQSLFDSMHRRISAVITAIEGENPGGCQGPPTLFHQPHERTCSSTAILSTPMPQKHYPFINIHVFSGIRTQTLRHRSQRR
ncbi:hypothetical protein TNCV_1926911 [Trichonephila clavipes]|nr:hypothetical protein TNCV_1926911 [Trichonephila clavipes]